MPQGSGRATGRTPPFGVSGMLRAPGAFPSLPLPA